MSRWQQGTPPITSYAHTNATEFFAEAYAAWRADPEFLQANAPVDGTAAEPEKAESGAAADRKRMQTTTNRFINPPIV